MKARYEEDFRPGNKYLHVWDRKNRQTTCYTLLSEDIPEGAERRACHIDTLEMIEDGNDYGRQFLQALADAAWEAGIYPRQIKDKQDELTAVKYHLEDMRKIVFSGTNLDQ